MQAPMGQSRHHESITARDLSRNVAAVLDRVEMERQTLLVTRGGRPVATLAPLSSHPRDEATPLVVVLSPVEEAILVKAAQRAPQVTRSFGDLGNTNEVDRALSTLELEGLLVRELAGYGITEQGALIAALLQARANA
jgi:prevent-host-death family protein